MVILHFWVSPHLTVVRGSPGVGSCWLTLASRARCRSLARSQPGRRLALGVSLWSQCASRCSDTPLQLSITCIGVLSFSRHVLHRGMSVIHRIERCLFSGQCPVISPVSVLSFTRINCASFLINCVSRHGIASLICLQPVVCVHIYCRGLCVTRFYIN